ncbi:hypothetical protein PC116_g23233 [Phytophthora cactorum]|nr:hypothetical protein PC116_g23233 [Phytophthora cactorum]
MEVQHRTSHAHCHDAAASPARSSSPIASTAPTSPTGLPNSSTTGSSTLMTGPVDTSGFTMSAQPTSPAVVRKSELLAVAEDTSASSAGVQKKSSGL